MTLYECRDCGELWREEQIKTVGRRVSSKAPVAGAIPARKRPGVCGPNWPLLGLSHTKCYQSLPGRFLKSTLRHLA